MSKEVVYLVDENNTVIGSKLRDDLTDDDCWRSIAIWIEDDNGNVLLQQRSLTKSTSPGKWSCAVEGTVEYGSTYDETAIRELTEEIGVQDMQLQRTKLAYYKADLGSRQAQGYKLVLNWAINKFTIQESEVKQLAWRSRNEVIAEFKNKDPKFGFHASVWLDMFDLV